MDSSKTARYLRGQYIAVTTCNKCHSSNLREENLPEISAAHLNIIKTYPEEDFQILMRRGIAHGGSENLGLMHSGANDRFSYFNEMELYDHYSFLKTTADK